MTLNKFKIGDRVRLKGATDTTFTVTDLNWHPVYPNTSFLITLICSDLKHKITAFSSDLITEQEYEFNKTLRTILTEN